MATAIRLLAHGKLTNSDAELYVTPVSVSAVVTSIRLVNTSGSAVQANLLIKRGSTGTPYHVSPNNLSIPAGGMYVDPDELNLEGFSVATNCDRLTGSAATTNVIEYVISGIERDVV
jgi:hypothetical protein